MRTILTKFVCLAVLISPIVVSQLISCPNNVTDCCLCTDSVCDVACPESLWTVTDTMFSVNCTEVTMATEGTTVTMTTSPSSTTTTSPSITTPSSDGTEDTEVTTITTITTTTTTVNDRPVTVCVSECPAGFYISNYTARLCDKCHPMCISCNNSSDNCTECYHSYQGQCVEDCPSGTNVSDNSTECVNSSDTKDGDGKKLPLEIIIGAAVGGGVLVIILVIVIVCCCWRKKSQTAKTGRTRMSVINELRKQEEGGREENVEIPLKETEKKKSRKPAGYENTAPVLGNMTQQVQNQNDKIFRYVTDPTTSTDKPKKTATVTRESGLYENESAIKGQRLQTLGRGAEQTEIESLPEAPKPPQAGLGKKALKPLPVPSKQASKPIAKETTKRSPVAKRQSAGSEGGEDYIQMDTPLEDDTAEQIYMNTDVGGEEIYENKVFIETEETYVAPDNPAEDPVEDLEDYENVQTTKSAYANFKFPNMEK